MPTIKHAQLSAADVRVLRIAIGKLQSLSVVDEEVLEIELAEIAALDFGFITYTAFDTIEIDPILHRPAVVANDPADTVMAPAVGEPVSRFGDQFLFEGGHCLACADALDPAAYPPLCGENLAALVVCDPPFNVPIRGHVTHRATAREFAMASGKMSGPQYVAFLRTAFTNLARHAADGSLSFQFIDWRHIDEMSEAGRAVYTSLLNLCVWQKSPPAQGSLYRSAHELCFVWKKGRANHCNRVQLGRHGRSRSNVWDYAGVSGFGRERAEAIARHATSKPVALIQDIILDVTRPGEIVLDAFAGSGTTLVAAHRARRRGFGLEIDAHHVDAAVRRLEQVTGAPARHAATGQTFAELEAERASGGASASASR